MALSLYDSGNESVTIIIHFPKKRNYIFVNHLMGAVIDDMITRDENYICAVLKQARRGGTKHEV